MRKNKLLLFILLLILLTGCDKETEIKSESVKDTTTKVEEITTEESTTEEKNVVKEESEEEAVASSQEPEQVSQQEQDSFSGLEPLPDVIEPEDNNSAVNPRITNASIILPGDFDKYMLFSGILTFMNNYDIKDTCTEIEMLEIYTQGTRGYKAILKFQNSPDEVVAIYKYDTFFDVQKFVDNDDVGYTEDDL